MDNLYKYLLDNFSESEPFFIKDISIPDMPSGTLRVKIKQLTDEGRLIRVSWGTYCIKGESENYTNIKEIIVRKYILSNGERIGYENFTSLEKIRTKNTITVTTNATGSEYRELQFGNIRLILKKSKCKITEDNYQILQFLDMVKGISIKTKEELDEAKIIASDLRIYLKNMNLTTQDLIPYLDYFPENIYRLLFKLNFLKIS